MISKAKNEFLKNTSKILQKIPILLILRISIFILGIIISIFVGGLKIILLVSFLTGIIITRINAFKPNLDIIFLINAGIFLIGLLIFIRNNSRILVFLSFIMGIYDGLYIKKRYQ